MSNKVLLHDKSFHSFIGKAEIAGSVSRLASQITSDYTGKSPLLLGVLNGSFMFLSDLIKEIKLPVSVSFVKLASYHGTQSSGSIQQLIGLNEDLKNRDVIIVEDIVDSGLTVEKLYKTVMEQQPATCEVVSLLFKPAAYQKNIQIKYRGFEVGNEFLVGYGLDYDGLGRNLPELYRLD